MVDLHTVCCMCGDIGFPDKLFRCTKCQYRFQHSYCSNYCDESSSTAPTGYCDWCLSEARSSTGKQQHGLLSSSRKSINPGKEANRSSSDNIKEDHHQLIISNSSTEKGKNNNASGAPSPKPSSRRYKFLKDVMC